MEIYRNEPCLQLSASFSTFCLCYKLFILFSEQYVQVVNFIGTLTKWLQVHRACTQFERRSQAEQDWRFSGLIKLTLLVNRWGESQFRSSANYWLKTFEEARMRLHGGELFWFQKIYCSLSERESELKFEELLLWISSDGKPGVHLELASLSRARLDGPHLHSTKNIPGPFSAPPQTLRRCWSRNLKNGGVIELPHIFKNFLKHHLRVNKEKSSGR